MISLKLLKPHRSITNLADVELPNFSIITGINGSGKSHLLEAIKSGAIKLDGINKPESEIKLFNWTNLVPNDAGAADPVQLGRERSQVISTLTASLESSKQNFIDTLATSNFNFLPLVDLKTVLSIDQKAYQDLAKGSGTPRNWALFEARRNQFLAQSICIDCEQPVTELSQGESYFCRCFHISIE